MELWLTFIYMIVQIILKMFLRVLVQFLTE